MLVRSSTSITSDALITLKKDKGSRIRDSFDLLTPNGSLPRH